MAWTYLILAGLCEVVYAALLKKTQGFTQSLPTALFLVAVVSIFVLLALAAREIPIGTAYAVYPPSVSPARQRSALFSIMSPPPRSVCSSW
jgi:multidrug transporter EmrE-like cation transporter